MLGPAGAERLEGFRVESDAGTLRGVLGLDAARSGVVLVSSSKEIAVAEWQWPKSVLLLKRLTAPAICHRVISRTNRSGVTVVADDRRLEIAFAAAALALLLGGVGAMWFAGPPPNSHQPTQAQGPVVR